MFFRERGTGGDLFEDRLAVQAQGERLAASWTLARYAPLPILAEALLLPLFDAPTGRTGAILVCAGQLALSLLVVAVARCVERATQPRRHAAGQVALALAAGVAWSLLPAVLTPLAGAALRPVLVAMMFGALALGPALGPVAGAWFLAPVVAGAALGAWRDGDPAQWIVAGVLLVLAGLVLGAEHRRRRSAREDAVTRLAAVERAALLDLLPQDDPRAPGAWFWTTDEALRLRQVSTLLAAAVGRPASRLEGKPVDRLFLGPAAAVAPSASAAALVAAMEGREAFRHRAVEHRPDEGHSLHWRVTGMPVLDATGRFLGYRGIGWDVSALHEAEDRIAHLLSHDVLTGLEGSESFRAAIARECRAAAAENGIRAVLLLNLDGFKDVNASRGHTGGDALLKHVAARLAGIAPRQATVARLGADEFAILYAPAHATSATAFARTVIAALRAPFDIDDVPVTIDASIGIALAPDHAGGADTLLRHADLALRRAKSAGKGRSLLFTPEFEYALAVQRELEADIRLALARGEFAVHYQPLLDLAEGRIVGLEALLRWTSPTRGSVSPANFIPAAEAGGLIVEIGRFVLNEACRAAAGWGNVRIAVNISPKHLRSPDFLADVTLALKMSGLTPTRLEIEITEGVFLDNDADALASLHALRARGIRIALDDFGTGYSSLNYLTSFPVDKIKIDRSFITHLLDRQENRAVVDAILTLARKLGLSVTAEGVETPEQALALKIRRCNEVQGFLLSKAQPAAAVEAMFADVPAELRRKVPALFESPLAALVDMRRRSAA